MITMCDFTAVQNVETVSTGWFVNHDEVTRTELIHTGMGRRNFK